MLAPTPSPSNPWPTYAPTTTDTTPTTPYPTYSPTAEEKEFAAAKTMDSAADSAATASNDAGVVILLLLGAVGIWANMN